MKFRLFSDLHLEFDSPVKHWTIPRLEGDKDTVLLLAGDITANHNQWKKNPQWDYFTPWIRNACKQFKAVIYVMGNHEFYHGVIQKVKDHWKSIQYDNLYVLDDEIMFLDGVRFVGGTLWTDFGNNPISEVDAMLHMNDFKVIKTYREGMKKKININDWHAMNRSTMRVIREAMETEHDGKTVVVTHHAPSHHSVGDEYRESNNDAYCNHLDNLIAYSDFDLWVHGHVHSTNDYKIGNTRIVSNPRGYADHDLNQNFDPECVLYLPL